MGEWGNTSKVSVIYIKKMVRFTYRIDFEVLLRSLMSYEIQNEQYGEVNTIVMINKRNGMRYERHALVL